jgi:hypothetical protein
MTCVAAGLFRSAAGHEKSRAGSGLIGLSASAASASDAALDSASAASADVNAVAATSAASVSTAAIVAGRALEVRLVPAFVLGDRRLTGAALVGRAAARDRDASYRLRSSESLNQSRAVFRRATRARVAEASTLGRWRSICAW